MAKKHTNIFSDTEVGAFSPDCKADLYVVEDAQRDCNYHHEHLIQMIKDVNNITTDYVILSGGIISDGGSGTVDISKCICLGKDSAGDVKLITIPAQTAVPLPSGWTDDRQIWVVGQYEYKLDTPTRIHKTAGTSYKYIIEDSFLGDTDSDDLFEDSAPSGKVILGSFQMNGTTFTNVAGQRSSSVALVYNKIHTVSSANYTLLTGDGISEVYVTTGASDRTITLPVISENASRKIKIVKVDDGIGKVICHPGSGNTINDSSTIEITEEFGYWNFTCVGSVWNGEAGINATVYKQSKSTNIALTKTEATFYQISDFQLTIEPGIYLVSWQMGIYVARAASMDGFEMYLGLTTTGGSSAWSHEELTLNPRNDGGTYEWVFINTQYQVNKRIIKVTSQSTFKMYHRQAWIQEEPDDFYLYNEGNDSYIKFEQIA